MSTTKFAESNRSRKRKINIWSLGITCVLIMFCAVYQTIILTTNCGRYFRVSNLIDPRFEQLFMLSLEIALMIGGLIGLCTNRGAFYFVFFSFWICTCMIQHFVDLVMGIIYMNTYGDGEDGVKYFMEETLKSVRKGKIFSISKINRVQRCKKCCGLTGPQDPQVQLSNNTLIAACCPDSTGTQMCTADNAFQAGCVEKLLKDDHKISLFHTFSGVSIIFQFYCYRGFLNTFV